MAVFLSILMDGLIYAAWLFVVALGMTLIFGVMRILNVAHGSFYAFGAYTMATLLNLITGAGLPFAYGFLAIPLAALAVGATLGTAMETGVLRWLHGRDEVAAALATFAMFLILEDAVPLIWGLDAIPTWQIYGLLGTTDIGGMTFNNYELSFILLAIIVGTAAWWALRHTRQGKIVLAVIHDPEAAQAFGINVRRVFPTVFAIGGMLGALAGAYSAPMITVYPGIGVDAVILAFAVVVIGGLGSVPGAMIGSLAVGLVRAATVHLLPQVELFVIYLVMTLVLLFRPSGLFAKPAARRI